MTAATVRVQVQPFDTHPVLTRAGGEMANAAVWSKGWLIGYNASGLLVPYTATTGLTSAGIAEKDETNVANDNRKANALAAVYSFLMHSGDELLVSDRYAVAWGKDNQTVCKTGTGLSPAGVFLGLDPTNSARALVWVGPTAAALAACLARDALTDTSEQSGTGTLSSGTLSIATATITSSSKILVSMRDPGAGALTTFIGLDVPVGTRVNGAPGTFVVNAIDNAKATLATAVCTFDWFVIN